MLGTGPTCETGSEDQGTRGREGEPGSCVAEGSQTASSAGELVYNATHGDTCYYVICSVNCTFQFFNWSCPSTPVPTSSPTPTTAKPTTPHRPPVPTTSTPSTTTKSPGCPDFDPPRKVSELGGLCFPISASVSRWLCGHHGYCCLELRGVAASKASDCLRASETYCPSGCPGQMSCLPDWLLRVSTVPQCGR